MPSNHSCVRSLISVGWNTRTAGAIALPLNSTSTPAPFAWPMATASVNEVPPTAFKVSAGVEKARVHAPIASSTSTVPLPPA